MILGSKRGSGINRLAHDSLMRLVIGGSFSIFPDKVKEFVPQVEQITLSGRAALEKGQEILVSSLV